MKPAKTSTWYFHKILFQLLVLNYHFWFNNKDYRENYSLPQSLPHQTLYCRRRQPRHLRNPKTTHHEKLRWEVRTIYSALFNQNIHRHGIHYLCLVLWYFLNYLHRHHPPLLTWLEILYNLNDIVHKIFYSQQNIWMRYFLSDFQKFENLWRLRTTPLGQWLIIS